MDAEFQNIPAELRAISNWVCWRFEEVNGKQTKVPLIPGSHARRASTTNPDTWSTFDSAHLQMNGHNGLGFVFTNAAGFVGVDLDHCRNPETGQIEAWAQGIVSRLNSYAELSPSGTGVHAIARGILAAGANKRGSVELYDHARYFVMTGAHIEGTPATIESADVSWLQRLMHAGLFAWRDERLRGLMNGIWEGGYPSHSEADEALCSLLAKLGLDASEIDGAFRISGLYREKWERRDYRERTISKVLQPQPRATPATVNAPESSPRADASTSMLVTERGSPQRILACASAALRESPEWSGVLAHDEFAHRTVTLRETPWGKKTGPWRDADDLHVCEWLQHRGVLVSTKIASEAVELVAHAAHFHPVKRYLESLVWDGQPGIEQWLQCCLGAPDTEFNQAIGARWLISAVARIYQPGCAADHLLLLQGAQGTFKSTALRTLAEPWFTDHVSELASKDSRLELAGQWIIELSELDRVRRGDLERVKSFLTCRVDNFRMPYGRRSEAVPRSCVFAGTSNDSTPLSDPTGARRFWPVATGRVDLNMLRANRDALWSEAFFRYKRGDAWWLDTPELNAIAKEEQEQRYEPGARDELLMAWISLPRPRDVVRAESLPWNASTPGRVNVQDALLHCFEIPKDRIRPADHHEVTRLLKHLGWRPIKEKQGRYRDLRYWVSPTPPGFPFGGGE